MSTKERVISESKLLAIVAIAAAVLLYGMIGIKAPSPVVLIATALTIIALSLVCGLKWDDVMDQILIIAKRIYPSILILIFVGMLIGAWIISGTIPAMVYYGLKLISPSIFLVAAVIICAITSIMTGTSWGTLSTVGVAMMGVAVGLGIPTPYAAGAIIVGSYFGDQMSPMSDTTILAPALSGADMIDHIKYMLITSTPSMILTLIFFFVIGLRYKDGTVATAEYSVILQTLEENFNINLFTLILPLITLFLIYKKKPVLLVFAIGIVLGVVFGIGFQGVGLKDALVALNKGYTTATGVEIVDKMILRGGIGSMNGSINIIISASILGGSLQASGALDLLAEKIKKLAKGPKSLMAFSYVFNGILSYTLAGAYTQFALVGPLMQPLYDDYGLARVNISRMLEETTTMLSVFVPWTANGAFILSTLGVTVADYWLYTPTVYLNIIFSMICIFTGFKIAKADPKVAEKD